MNKGEFHFCEWKFGESEEYWRRIFSLMTIASKEQLEILEKTHPEEVKAFKKSKEDKKYLGRLQQEYLNTVFASESHAEEYGEIE